MAACGAAQTDRASEPAVELKGTITRVQVTHGAGMPYLELKTEKGTRRVMLGSMRYLMEQNFNPKAGSTAIVKGFENGDAIAAQTISIPADKISIRLRDEDGTPLWRRGRYGRQNR
jgi:hypothetical protein